MIETTITVKIRHEEPLTPEAVDALHWNVQLAVTEPGDDDGSDFRPYPHVELTTLTVVSE